MLAGRKNRQTVLHRPIAGRVRTAEDTQRKRSSSVANYAHSNDHPFTCSDENTRLYSYENRTKGAFDKIEATLRRVSAMQHEADFVGRAQAFVESELGFRLPEHLLDSAWVAPLDMRALYAWCVFETFRLFADEFYNDAPLVRGDEEDFQRFIESCGFHTLDVSPCADGRLAHVIRYVLRFPYRGVRRKSYAGAMFDVEDSLQKWTEVEYKRHHEGVPNTADAPTRYLKAAVYHYSSSLPCVEGCAAHGSDTAKAAEGALSRLQAFKTGVENSYCCGASIDLLLIGIDTDNDTIRVHVPDEQGRVDTASYIDSKDIYDATRNDASGSAKRTISSLVEQAASKQGISAASGMIEFIARLFYNNISQIDYVRRYHQACYADIGHQERFIGMGIGFEEVQLRNLTYFAYLKTVEQGAKDVDVGIKIFTGLNISRGLPAPVVIRYDYHGNVPGARERAVARCQCLEKALHSRFPEQTSSGLVHTLLVVRDCNGNNTVELVGGSVSAERAVGGH